MSKTLKPFPTFSTDEEAEHFVDTADLSEYDLSGFKPVTFFFPNWNLSPPSQQKETSSDTPPDSDQCH